ncbi:MAG: dockerin type I repeat-containing protein [candidate division Zixibacteria bacterium]|nr:dockerin type I repeat-containing protein [candidate division Zixibacteria bacterium]
MKKSILIIPLLLVFYVFSVLPCFAQDPGEPDTVRFLDWGYYVVCPPCTGRAVIPMYVVNDESLWSMTIPLKWTGPLDVDTAIFVGERSDFMIQKYFSPNHQDSTFLLFATILAGDQSIPPGEGILIYIYFTVQDTGYASLDLTVPPLSFYHFLDQDENVIQPLFYPVEFYIGEQNTPPGDVNQDGGASVSDVVYLINYLFKGGTPPAHLPSGDVNLDCDVTISDVIYLINFLFKGGKSLELGCCYN